MDVTRYVVLYRNDEPAWVVIHGTVKAHSPEAAIRQIGPVDGVAYVAVPERSWKPLSVAVETRKQVTVAPVSEKEQQ
jgi:hypothetical protein